MPPTSSARAQYLAGAELEQNMSKTPLTITFIMGIQTNQHINTVFNPLFPPPPMAKESCRHTTKTIYTIYTMIKPTIINYDKTMIKIFN